MKQLWIHESFILEIREIVQFVKVLPRETFLPYVCTKFSHKLVVQTVDSLKGMMK